MRTESHLLPLSQDADHVPIAAPVLLPCLVLLLIILREHLLLMLGVIARLHVYDVAVLLNHDYIMHL